MVGTNATTEAIPAPDQSPTRQAVGLQVEPAGEETTREISLTIARALGLPDKYAADVGKVIVPVIVVKDISKNLGDRTFDGPPYRIIAVDLTNARNDLTLLDGTKDMVISQVTIAVLPAGASFRLAIGQRDGLLIGGNGLPVGTAIDLETPEQRGLRISNAAQAGVTIELLIGTGGMSA